MDIKNPNEIQTQRYWMELKKSAPNFDIEIKRIVNKYTAAEFPSRFVSCIIDNFDSGKDNLIIPQWLL